MTGDEWPWIRDRWVPVAQEYKSVQRMAEIEREIAHLRDEAHKLFYGAKGALSRAGCPSEHSDQVIRVARNRAVIDMTEESGAQRVEPLAPGAERLGSAGEFLADLAASAAQRRERWAKEAGDA